MQITATDAKNRFGQMLELCQREPVTIEKSGRRHSVLISASRYDELVTKPANEAAGAAGQQFYEKYKEWVDLQNEIVEKHGIFGEEYRVW